MRVKHIDVIDNKIVQPPDAPQKLFAESVLPLLPPGLYQAAAALPGSVQARIEEIRVREGRPLEVIYGGQYGFVGPDGSIGRETSGAHTVSREDCAQLLERLTRHSLYSFEEELKRGFITVEGGHRVGLAGRTVLEDGRVRMIRDVSGFNIRIAREVPGCGRAVLPSILDAAGRSVHHTLVISPPGHGKTTMIRDLARLISEGEWPVSGGYGGGRKVGIVDERSEIAACVRGVPRFRLGPRTDVLDGCPKAEGMMMLIRSMSPEVLVVDEIGRPEDALAVHEAIHAGIRIIATAHGASREDVLSRPVLRELTASGVFRRLVILQGRGASVRVESLTGARHSAEGGMAGC
ncbi:stage III sporulation protein AA [Paenibacillus sp. YN15]|uniref:stage III sporulation protein AA n=1 Tax=Paenibacillus sp. YN15 TaxID=1742774 RepID=UPI000DCB7A26|nr:stage III sporulation protein AA [Paenibacillus sp. YN15]RAV00982.1 stage III sporulation protein AA [Paenibacillus sp. YN15]